MEVEFDKEADAAYIYFKSGLGKGEVKRTVSLDGNINLDFDSDDKLVGIEILNASKVVPKKGLVELASQ